MITELTDSLISVCRGFGAAERTAVCCGEVNVAQCVALQFIKRRSEKGSEPLRREQKLQEIDSPPKGQTPFRIGTKSASPTVTALADFMGVTRGSATKLSDGLVDRGWVRRDRDTRDGRRVILQLTPAGVKLANELRQRTEAMVAATVADLSQQDQRSLLRGLKLLEQVFASACCGNNRNIV